MSPQSPTDHQKLLTEVIKKQIIILGPDITLAKARNVPGLTVADDGTVTQVVGNPQEITQKLVEQFMELSGLIVKKTMEPLLAGLPDGVADGVTQAATQQVESAATVAAAVTPQPSFQTPTPVQTPPTVVAAPQPAPAVIPTPVSPTQPIQPQPTQPVVQTATQTPPPKPLAETVANPAVPSTQSSS